jgi:hypothetical protein
MVMLELFEFCLILGTTFNHWTLMVTHLQSGHLGFPAYTMVYNFIWSKFRHHQSLSGERNESHLFLKLLSTSEGTMKGDFRGDYAS